MNSSAAPAVSASSHLAMSTARRYHINTLHLVRPDANTLHALQSAIDRSLEIMSDVNLSDDSTIYTGKSGILLMYLRLHIQSSALSPSPPAPPAIHFQDSLPRRPKPNRVSPLHAEHGPYTVALLQCLITGDIPLDDLFLPIQTALSVSTSPDAVHEVLYGTAGLLASLVSIGRFGASHPVAASSNILALVNRLIEEGRAGAAEYAVHHGTGLPLMWAWHGKYYLGAIHGVAGILTILLQLPSEIRDLTMATILPAAYALLNQVDADGHLPSSLPRRHRSSGELVQLCHGAPGALLLIAAIRSACAGQKMPTELETIETRLSDRIWSEGLLSKGMPLCHGIIGNAWPWLLLSQLHQDEERRELYLSRALAFLLHATRLPPAGNMDGYGTPDSPYSLFEGLAGAVCAWSEACAILRNRLNTVETAEKTKQSQVLGMPWLGGMGSCGL